MVVPHVLTQTRFSHWFQTSITFHEGISNVVALLLVRVSSASTHKWGIATPACVQSFPCMYPNVALERTSCAKSNITYLTVMQFLSRVPSAKLSELVDFSRSEMSCRILGIVWTVSVSTLGNVVLTRQLWRIPFCTLHNCKVSLLYEFSCSMPVLALLVAVLYGQM